MIELNERFIDQFFLKLESIDNNLKQLFGLIPTPYILF